MKIYVAHSTSFDYQSELYVPIRKSDLVKKHKFIFPYSDRIEEISNSKAIIENVDLILAEVSYPSTGEGIELGWADSFGKPIVCFYKAGTKVSRSLDCLRARKISYSDSDDLITKIASATGDQY